ncbi:MAG TPA: cytochrome c [Gaiellaceae bacterium]|nr:cytochrome c [Gaiellaceae bacterium]
MLRGGRSRFVACCSLAGVALLLAGCGSGKVVEPLPSKVVGPLPKPAAAVKGNPTAGKAVFTSAGCGACHTLTAAASTGKIGPNLDDLTAEAAKAGEPLEAFIKESIVSPSAYIAPGYAGGIMPATFGTSLSAQQLADLVAFVNQSK